MLLRDPVRSVFLLIIIAILFGAIAWSGIETGTDRILPGSIVRARDSIAIAQSVLRDHKWTGFAAYMDIVRALDQHGLTLDEAMAQRKFGTSDYQSFLYRPEITGAAIAAGRNVEIKNPDQLWFVDGDDTGLASYYILAFLLFGQSVDSLFYLYLLLLGGTTFAFSMKFWRKPEFLTLAAMFLFSIHVLVFVTVNIKPDVNSILSSRFLPILGLLATLHLLLLMVFKEPFRFGGFALATLQILILLFLVHVRASAMWMVLALLAAGGGLLMLQHAHSRREMPSTNFSGRRLLDVWPATMLFALLIASIIVFGQLKHPSYRDSRLVSQHVFWHSFVTVLHNNPRRTELFGIEKTPMLDPRGDGLSYHVFDEYLRAHGLRRATYTSNSAERDRLAGVDFLWGPYDGILKLAFWEAVWKEPTYAAASLFFHQPVTVIQTLASAVVKYSGIILSLFNVGCLIVIALLTPRCAQTLKIATVLFFMLAFSFIPTMTVAPQELRVMDAFAMLLVSAASILFLVLKSFRRKPVS